MRRSPLLDLAPSRRSGHGPDPLCRRGPSSLLTTLPALLLAAPLLSSCALGGEDPQPAAEPFEPRFAPAEDRGVGGRAGDGRDGGGRARGDGPDGGTDPRRDGRPGGRPDDRGGQDTGPDAGRGSGGPATGDGPGAGPSAPAEATASVTDPSGDASGSGTPAWADLVGGTLRRTDAGWTVVLELAGTVPATTSGDRVLDLTLWVDRDGDGAIDDEVLAQLGSEGWTTAYRDPQGARYGSDSGVDVQSSGATVTLALPAGHLGGDRTLRWALGAEHGSLAAMTAGTASRDTAPDAGAAPFPG